MLGGWEAQSQRKHPPITRPVLCSDKKIKLLAKARSLPNTNHHLTIIDSYEKVRKRKAK